MTDLAKQITAALDWCKSEGVDIPLDIQLKARQFGALKAGGDVVGINATYHDAITQALIDYFEGGPIGASRSQFKQAMIQAFGDAFDLGWTARGGELPIPDDAIAWVEARLNQESGHIDTVFEQAKQLRKDKEFDFFAWASARADGYTGSVAELYNAGQMLADGRQMLTWEIGPTEKSCKTCSKLDGERHRADWFLSRNYIPGKPGADMDCGGYNCLCRLVDDNGEEFTI